MKKYILWIVFLCFSIPAGFNSPVLAAEEETIKLVEKIKPSVVTILVFNEKDEPISQGSGFFIAEDRIATNHHVIANAHHAQIKTASGDLFSVQGLLGEDRLKDVAVLAMKVPKTHSRPLVLSKSLPKEGQEIVVIGSPLGLEQTVSNGIVSAVRDVPGLGNIIQFTARVSPGSSGSAVVDKTGVVIGIVVSQFTEGQNLNFSIPASQIIDLKIGKVQMLEAWSKNKLSSSNELVEKEFSLGVSAYLKEDYKEAIIHLMNVIEFVPNNDLAYAGLGYSYGELGQYEKEIESYKQVIRINPDFADVHYNLGVCYGKLGQHEKAIEAYKQAIRIKPDDAKAYYNIGVDYGELGQYEKAIEAFKQSIQIKPNLVKAHHNLGMAYGKLGQYENEIESYKQIIRINPNDAEIHFYLGVAYGRLGQHKKEIESYKQAILINPADAKMHINLGLVYGYLGQNEKAIKAYKQAIRIKPDDAKTHFNLGLAFLMLNKKGDALDEYKILKNLDPEMAKKLFDLIYMQ